MMTTFRRPGRRGRIATLTFLLGALTFGGTEVLAQKPADPPQKEVTDGFFDVPAREVEPSWGLPAYLVTCALGGAAIAILCKSARRG